LAGRSTDAVSSTKLGIALRYLGRLFPELLQLLSLLGRQCSNLLVRQVISHLQDRPGVGDKGMPSDHDFWTRPQCGSHAAHVLQCGSDQSSSLTFPVTTCS
jgi:hypothetical protein